MKVRMPTVEVDAEFRRRLRIYFGEPGLATREEVRSWRIERGVQVDNDLYSDTDAEWVAEGGETCSFRNEEEEE